MNFDDADVYLRNLRQKISELQGESTPNEKFLLASNALAQIEEHVPSIATHQTLSKCLEKLISLSALSLLEDSKEHLHEKIELCKGLMRLLIIKADVELLSKDMFGSHVLQSVLQYCTLCEQYGANFDDLLQYFCNVIEEKCLFELLHHSSGSHLLRSLLRALAGVLDSDAFVKNRKKTDESDILTQSRGKLAEWREKRLRHWAFLWRKDLNGIMKSSQACATVCLLLKLGKIFPKGMEKGFLKELMSFALERCESCKFASFTLENCLELCDNSEFHAFFTNHMLPQLQSLAENHLANYIVQSSIKNKFFQRSHLEASISELDFAKLLGGSFSAIIWRLCESCVLLASCQSQFIKKLFSSLNIKEGRGSIWLSLVSCLPCCESREIHVRATGCSILLNLLRFESNLITKLLGDFKHFVKIAQSQDRLMALATDKHFSRVLQLLLDRRLGLLKEKQISRLFKVLQPQFMELSLDVNGAFVISGLFNACSLNRRRLMLEILAPFVDKISARNRKLSSCIGLDSFVKNESLWLNKQKKVDSVRALFKDIINNRLEADN